VLRELCCQPPRLFRPLSADNAEGARGDEQCERRIDPGGAVPLSAEVDEPEPEREHDHHSESDEQNADPGQVEQESDLARPTAPSRCLEGDTGDDHATDEEERAE
jgi:hypothetical protein